MDYLVPARGNRPLRRYVIQLCWDGTERYLQALRGVQNGSYVCSADSGKDLASSIKVRQNAHQSTLSLRVFCMVDKTAVTK